MHNLLFTNNQMKKYKVIKHISSLVEWGEVWYIETLDDKFILDDGSSSIPVSRLVEQWYLQEVKDKVAYNGMKEIDKENTVFVQGFAFSDDAMAEKRNKKMRTLKKIRQWSAENDEWFVPDWSDKNQEKHSIWYNHKNWTRGIGYDTYSSKITIIVYFQSDFFLPYFSSAKKARQCIKELSLDNLLD